MSDRTVSLDEFNSLAEDNARLGAKIERLTAAIQKAHYALTKSSLTADERVWDATRVLAEFNPHKRTGE